MSSLDSVNRQWLLAERPTGAPTLDTLRLSEAEVPTPGAGQMLLHTEFLSLDPYMRGRMGDAPSYAPPVPLGGVMVGGTVARVVTSEVAGFAPGDWVLCLSGWQDYAVSDGRGVTNLGRSPEHPSWALGILGMATALPEGPDRMSWLMGQLLRKRILMQGFIIFDDFGDRYGEFAAAMAGWLEGGAMKYREDVIDGPERAPAAFIGLLRGENFGKRVIRVGDARKP
jgi:NADPH-dependent curcumin reductase CurA